MADRWPALMDLPTACRYLTYTRRQFKALIEAGQLPKATATLPGAHRWNRRTLDRALERLEQRETVIDHEREGEETRQAIANFRPTALRRGHQGAERRGVPVLPARRAKDTASTA